MGIDKGSKEKGRQITLQRHIPVCQKWDAAKIRAQRPTELDQTGPPYSGVLPTYQISHPMWWCIICFPMFLSATQSFPIENIPTVPSAIEQVQLSF